MSSKPPKDYGTYLSYELGGGVHVVAPKDKRITPFSIRPRKLGGFESICLNRSRYEAKTKQACIAQTMSGESKKLP